MGNNIEELSPFIIMKELDVTSNLTNFTKMSFTAASLCGWKKPELSYGKSDYDIPSAISESAAQFIELDRYSLQYQVKLITIEVQNYFGGWKSMLVERTPTASNQLTIQAIEIADTIFFNTIYSSLKLDTKTFSNKKQTMCKVVGEVPCKLDNLILSNPSIKPNESLSKKDFIQNNIIKSPLQEISLNTAKNIDLMLKLGSFGFTPKELTCVSYALDGYTIKQIAGFLDRSPRTVETHLNKIKLKLKAKNIKQAIALLSKHAYD